VLGRSGKALGRDRGPKGSSAELNKLQGSRQKGLGLASSGVGGLSRFPSLVCRIIRNDTHYRPMVCLIVHGPVQDAGTWRGCWLAVWGMSGGPTTAILLSFLLREIFTVFSTSGVVRLFGLGPWSHSSCGGTVLACLCVRARHIPSFLCVPRR
jgi:hypothetical protein